MHKAKQVVETWDRQFHSSPREQRLAFLYLANDILQNSRRKGSEFVDEFWKFLPDALCDVIENGGEFGKSAVLRLVIFYPTLILSHLPLSIASIFGFYMVDEYCVR